MGKDKTGSKNGRRVIYSPGCIEPRKQCAKLEAKMFQVAHSRKKGKRK